MRTLLFVLTFLLIAERGPITLGANELDWTDQVDQKFSVEFHLSSDQIESTKQIKLTGTIRYPEGYQIEIPLVQGSGRSDPFIETQPYKQAFTFQNWSLSPPKAKEGMMEQSFQVNLIPWQSGQIPFTLGKIEFHKSTGEVTSLYTRVVILQVDPTNKQLAEIKVEPKFVSLTQSSQLGLTQENRLKLTDEARLALERERSGEILARRNLTWKPILFILLLAILLYIIWRKREAFLLKQQALSLSPRERAIAALRELEEKRLPEQGMGEMFYVELTLIVRYFMEEEYGVDAPEQTTEEFLNALSKSDRCNPEMSHKLQQFMLQADLVKYARATASADDCKQALTSAQEVVK